MEPNLQPTWQLKYHIGNRLIMARLTARHIVVRVQLAGAKSGQYAEFEVPREFGIGPAMEKANDQTSDEDLV